MASKPGTLSELKEGTITAMKPSSAAVFALSLLTLALLKDLSQPALAAPPWLKCTFSEPTPTDPTKLASWHMLSQEARKSVEFVNTRGERRTLSALYTPSQILFIYPKQISRDVSYEIEFRLNRKTLAITKQVSNEPGSSSGTCAFAPAP